MRGIGSDLRMEYSAIGLTTHLASRMEQLAPPGHTLLTAGTLNLVEGYVQVVSEGLVPIKGLGQPMEAFWLLGTAEARTRIQAGAARGLTRFVGRQRELDAIGLALESAAGGHGQVLALVGDPGVGKSRIVWETVRSGASRAGSSSRAGRSRMAAPRPTARCATCSAPSSISARATIDARSRTG